MKIKKLLLSVFLLLTANCLVPVFSNAQNISTIAGTGTAGYSGDGGAATSARLNYPWAVYADGSGNVYIAEQVNYTIRKVTIATGIITTIAGNGTFGFSGDGGAATSAQLGSAFGVAVDAFGNVYIVDSNHRIRKVTASTGIITTIAGTGVGGYNGDGIAATTAQLFGPRAVYLDCSDNLYIADYQNQRIRKITAATGIISTIAGTGALGFSGDGGAATNAQLNNPFGVCTDVSGNVYIADRGNHRIRKVNASTGIITTIAGTGVGGYNGDGIVATSAQLGQPEEVFADVSGNVYIADYDNNRIRKITASTGIITTIAGNGTFGFSGDGGPATSARLNGPTGICLDGSSNLYIADYNGNHRIRKVTNIATPPCPVVLPIELLYFTAACKENRAELNWGTATETNNDYFTIERTLNGLDYQVIGIVKGAGSSSTTQYYSLTDNEPLAGIAYYRLKQTDFDGQYEYFPFVAASCGKGIDIISIYPNPAIGDINIIVSSSDLTGVTMNLIDVLSRKVFSQTAHAKQGDNTFTVDVSTLSSGSYMLQVVTESGLYRAQKQFVIK